MGLELRIGEHYSLQELTNKHSLQLLRSVELCSFFKTKNNIIYYFRHEKFKQLKIKYVLTKAFDENIKEAYTFYDAEKEYDDIFNCCGSSRLLL